MKIIDWEDFVLKVLVPICVIIISTGFVLDILDRAKNKDRYNIKIECQHVGKSHGVEKPPIKLTPIEKKVKEWGDENK